MKLKPGQRITMIKECATLLDKEDFDDIDLILSQHGLPTTDFFQGEGARAYVIEMIRDAADEPLQQLHAYLIGEASSGLPGVSAFDGDHVSVFFSHLTAHRELVGNVSKAVAHFGVQAFVAHDSIEPSREWQAVIEAGLDQCDAMVVFLHDKFSESSWCDQEVGWVMGRHRPVLPLWFDVPPYGFMGKLQAQRVGTMDTYQIADSIIEWLLAQPALHACLAPGISQAFANSRSYDFTRKTAAMLERLNTIDNDSLDLLVSAAAKNNQISDANIRYAPAPDAFKQGPEWVRDFVAARREPTAPAPDPWGALDVPF